jgi:hypothetical protein
MTSRNLHPRRTTSEPLDGQMTEVSPLAADVLGPGVAKIASYTPDSERRVRHLIAKYDFPHVYIGGLIYSRKSWLERYYNGERAIVNGKSAK